MLGNLIRNFMGGRQAAKAYEIITKITGCPPTQRQTESLQEYGAIGSYFNESELALSTMILDCKDRYDLGGNLASAVDPIIRQRILSFYTECKSNGLIRSSYVIEQFESVISETRNVDEVSKQRYSQDKAAKAKPDIQQAIQKPLTVTVTNQIKQGPSTRKAWSMVENGLLNTITGELIPSAYLQKTSEPVPGYNITSFSYSTVWVREIEVEK
jgi:hypothetical protein